MFYDDIIRINWRTVVVVLWALLFALTLAGAVYTYISTPDVENFRGFAEPGGTKEEGKALYLFTPVVFVLIGVTYAISTMRRYKPDEEVDVLRLLIVTGLIFLAVLMTALSCTRALQQAAIEKSQPQEEAKTSP